MCGGLEADVFAAHASDDVQHAINLLGRAAILRVSLLQAIVSRFEWWQQQSMRCGICSSVWSGGFVNGGGLERLWARCFWSHPESPESRERHLETYYYISICVSRICHVGSQGHSVLVGTLRNWYRMLHSTHRSSKYTMHNVACFSTPYMLPLRVWATR